VQSNHFDYFFKNFEISNFFGPSLECSNKPDIEKRQLSRNGAKNFIDGVGSIEVLIFIYPKHKACH